MNTGEYWKSKNKLTMIKITQFLGNDTWSCRNLRNGSDDDLFGSYIYDNFDKIEDAKEIEVYEEDMKEFNKTLKKLTRKVLRKITKEKK